MLRQCIRNLGFTLGVVALGASLIVGSPTRAAELKPSGEVLLLDGNTLLGWTQTAGASPWQLSGGRVKSSPASGPLQVEHTFGDAVWTVRWMATSSGPLVVEFPAVPMKDGAPVGPTLRVRLTAGAGCGELFSGDKSVSPGANVPAKAGTTRTAVITRQAGKLAVQVDGQNVSTIASETGLRTGLSLRAPEGAVEIVSLAVREAGFHPLFNGKNLSEFNVGDARVRWTVDKDGKIVTESAQGNYLRTNDLYQNFTLSLDYRISAGGNSGVGIRTPVGGWPSADGMEVQILDQPDSAPIFSGSLGSLYRNLPPVRRADLRSPEWNRLVIKADGPMVGVWINGHLVNHGNVARHYVLRSRSRTGWIGFQDHGGKVEFRNIEIAEAPAHDGFPQWTASEPTTGAGLTLGPAMDPSELIPRRRLENNVLQGVHPGKVEPKSTLAEFTGPGAVTRIFRSNDSGELAFYFDGESTPRLTSSWHSLRNTLPDFGSTARELFTYLPFKKSLKIEQRGSPPASYQLGWQRFLAGTVVPEGTAPLSGPDRGWQHAIEYVRHNHEFGTASLDPAVRPATLGSVDCPPGKSVTLAESLQSGLCRWLRFTFPNGAALATNDLWIDIHVDGEQQPAISAPARLLLPALVPDLGPTPMGDLVQVRKGDQYTWLWPMPCARGIKVVARNTGSQSATGVSATVGLLPLPNRRIPASRLRGHLFRAKSGEAHEWLSATGRGKLVWLSVDTPASDLGSVSKLLVDQQPQPAWQNLSVAGWLGRDTPSAPHNSGHGGSVGTLLWRNFLLDPISFEKSLELDLTTSPSDWQTLALYFIEPVAR